MFWAMSSDGRPGRIRDTPPLTTLLTYLVPSGRITRPSFPGCDAFSVETSMPVGVNVCTSSVPMFTTTTLPFGSSAMPLGWRSGAPCTRIDASPLGVILDRRHTSELQSLAYLVCRLLLEKK